MVHAGLVYALQLNLVESIGWDYNVWPLQVCLWLRSRNLVAATHAKAPKTWQMQGNTLASDQPVWRPTECGYISLWFGMRSMDIPECVGQCRGERLGIVC